MYKLSLLLYRLTLSVINRPLFIFCTLLCWFYYAASCCTYMQYNYRRKCSFARRIFSDGNEKHLVSFVIFFLFSPLEFHPVCTTHPRRITIIYLLSVSFDSSIVDIMCTHRMGSSWHNVQNPAPLKSRSTTILNIMGECDSFGCIIRLSRRRRTESAVSVFFSVFSSSAAAKIRTATR